MAQESPENAPPEYLKTYNQDGNRGAALNPVSSATPPLLSGMPGTAALAI
jgi:hypothetical protein